MNLELRDPTLSYSRLAFCMYIYIFFLIKYDFHIDYKICLFYIRHANPKEKKKKKQKQKKLWMMKMIVIL